MLIYTRNVYVYIRENIYNYLWFETRRIIVYEFNFPNNISVDSSFNGNL